MAARTANGTVFVPHTFLTCEGKNALPWTCSGDLCSAAAAAVTKIEIAGAFFSPNKSPVYFFHVIEDQKVAGTPKSASLGKII